MVISVLAAGQSVTLVRSFGEDEVADYAAISQTTGIRNNSEVPTGLLGSHLTGQLVDKLLGQGTTVRGLFLTFPRQVYAGEYLESTATVASIDESVGLVRLALKASTIAGECVKGEVVVTLPIGRTSNA